MFAHCTFCAGACLSEKLLISTSGKCRNYWILEHLPLRIQDYPLRIGGLAMQGANAPCATQLSAQRACLPCRAIMRVGLYCRL